MRACLETHEFRSGLWHARNVQHAYFYAKETEKKSIIEGEMQSIYFYK